jgi:hypothetical protein
LVIRPTFSGAAVLFEVTITNPTSGNLRSLRLTPPPVPSDVPVDREQHLIPLLRPRNDRRVAFRLRPGPDEHVVALDVTVVWEDDAGTSKGRSRVSSKPIDLTSPKLDGPRDGVERWRSNLRGGVAIEQRIRQDAPPTEVLDGLEETLTTIPGTMSTSRDEGPRGLAGRIWVRADAGKGKVAGLLVDVTPDPRTGGSRVLITVSASYEELLTKFYHLVLGPLEAALQGFRESVPHDLTDGH